METSDIQQLADNLVGAMAVIKDEEQCAVWAWFGGERVYQYSTLSGKEIDSFYNGAWSKDVYLKDVIAYTEEHIKDLKTELEQEA